MTKHGHWVPDAIGGEGVPDNAERVPSTEVWYHGGHVYVLGVPDQEAPDGTGHSCDEMWCGSVTPHVLAIAKVLRPSDLSRSDPG